MRDDGLSLSAAATGFILIGGEHRRRALIEACDWLIGHERQSQRDGLPPEEVDRSLDQLTDAMALRERLQQLGQAVAVPLAVVPVLIDELAGQLRDAATGEDSRLVLADLSELLAQLERLPEADA